MIFVSGGKDIYNGIQEGNGWLIALGVGSIVLDVFTLGGSSLVKGAIKTAVKEGAEMLIKKEAKTVLTQTFKEQGKVFFTEGVKEKLVKFGCFVKGTPVWTADSTITIEKIKEGSYVYAYDINKRQVVKKKVTKAYIREVDQLVKIDYSGEVIYTTTEHPFYINNGWVKAGELKAGDPLFLKDGKTKISVQKITVIDTVVTVYNITVADAHDYYVGHSKVLVHNNPCAQLTKAQSKAVKSLEGQIAKHEQKLAEYIKDPLKFDNKGFLKNAPNEAVRQKIIQTRINHLRTEMKTFRENIQKIINGL